MILSETETLIWDWNGTLLDDVEVNVKVNAFKKEFTPAGYKYL